MFAKIRTCLQLSGRQVPAIAPSGLRVVAVVVPHMSPLEISVASEFFGIERADLGRDWYRFTICTPEPGLVPLEGDAPPGRHGLEQLRRADMIVIPGWCERVKRPEPEILAALEAAARPRGPAGVVLHRGVRAGRRRRARRSTGDDALGRGRRLPPADPTIDARPRRALRAGRRHLDLGRIRSLHRLRARHHP